MSMTIERAKDFVNAEIARIESENPVGELRPWHRDACPAAQEHWGRIQQRIALSRRDLSSACLEGLDIQLPERTEAQKRAAAASGQRLARQRSNLGVLAA